LTGTFVTRAPGKLFLLGEYAVLDGGPAVVAAVSRHVRVKLTRDDGDSTGFVRVRSPEHGSADFIAADPPAAEGGLRFAIAAFRSATRRCAPAAEAWAIDIESDLDTQQTKIGLGSSAAVSVAVTAAVLAASGHTPRVDGFRQELLRSALQAHRTAQNGVGSGADVAACVWGGLIRFDRGSSVGPSIVPLPVPRGTHLLVGWTGTAAPTHELVSRYRNALNENEGRRRAFLRASRRCVDDFVSALARGSVALDAVDANGRLLEQLADDCGLSLMTPGLRDLVHIARAHGAAAKAAGAGGGDCGIALTHDDAAATRIAAAWRDSGIVPLDLSLSTEGVTIARS
jgi:phosphomevalonate kinase